MRRAWRRIRDGLRVELFSRHFGYNFVVNYQKNQNQSLALLCDQYGSDKGQVSTSGRPYSGPAHTYTDMYSLLFDHCRHTVQNVFECGLGTNNPDLPSSMGIMGKPGASLRVWRDYFPNASIFGADIDKDILFQEERIRTGYLDQLNPSEIKAYWAEVGAVDFDLMVDDGLHTFEAGTCLFTHSIDRLGPNGIYVIEDVDKSDLNAYRQFFEKQSCPVQFVTLFRPNKGLADNSMIIIRKS